MKKNAKVSAVCAALVLALVSVGCSNDDAEFEPVSSADELKFKVGTYEMTMVDRREGAQLSRTEIYAVEIKPTDVVTFQKTATKTTYDTKALYDENKGSFENDDNYSYTFDDNTRTVIRTYAQPEFSTMTLADFKTVLWSLPEDDFDDEYGKKYTDKTLGHKDGVIQMSYTTEAYSESDGQVDENGNIVEEGKKEHVRVFVTMTLTPQK